MPVVHWLLRQDAASSWAEPWFRVTLAASYGRMLTQQPVLRLLYAVP